MLFSVLIPMYNAEKFIGECLESVLAQTYDDYEIVIVNDGSTDNSLKVAEEYRKKHSQKIRLIDKENTGVLLTRRRLLQEAKGDYIVWVDSDDLIKKDMLSDLSDEIKRINPDIIVLNYEFLDNPEKVVRSLDVDDRTVLEGDNKHIAYTKMILGRNMNEVVTKCIRRNIIDIDADYSEYKHVRMGDDLFCLLPVFDAAEKIEYLNRSYYRCRINLSSITHTKTYLQYYSYRTLFERELYFVKKWGFSPEEINRVKDKFAYVTVDYLVLSVNSSNKSFRQFSDFAKDVAKCEMKNVIYTDGSRTLKSKPYQFFYKLFTKKRYLSLYCSIVLVTKMSKIIRGFWR